MRPDQAAIAVALKNLAPRLPERDAAEIVDHARRSKGLRQASPETAAWLSLVAFARHAYTDYDDMLAEGYDPDSARHFCLDSMNEVLQGWGVRRVIGAED